MRLSYTVRFWLAAFAILLLAAAVHLSMIKLTPWDWDEPVYTRVAEGIAETGHPSLNLQGDGEWYPFHPPFHFALLHVWYQLFGASIESGRLLSSLIAVAIVALAMKLTRVLTADPVITLAVGFLLALDGWFAYSSLLVKLDGSAIVLGLCGLIAFGQATSLENQQVAMRWAYLAGILIGAAAIYKHIAVIFLAAIVVHLLLTREHKRQHAVVMILALTMLATYIITMMVLVNGPYQDATMVQIRRVFGEQEARGLSYGPKEAVSALIDTYWAFAGSVLVLVLGGLTMIRQMWLHFRGQRRFFAVATAWTISAGVFLLAIKLRNPHYLSFLIVPATIVLAMQIREWMWRGSDVHVLLGRSLLAVILICNVATLFIRVQRFSETNALQETAAAAERLIPANARVLSEEPICALIEQDCFKLGNYQTQGKLDKLAPHYLIVYESKTQTPPQTEAMLSLIARSTKVFSVKGWKETITVYRTPYTDDYTMVSGG